MQGPSRTLHFICELGNLNLLLTGSFAASCFRAPPWSIWSLDFRQGRKPCLRVLKCNKSACADFDGARSPEEDFIPAVVRQTPAQRARASTDIAPRRSGVIDLDIQSSTSFSPARAYGI